MKSMFAHPHKVSNLITWHDMAKVVSYYQTSPWLTTEMKTNGDGIYQKYWRLNHFITFCRTVESIYDRSFSQLWKIKTSLKVKIFSWLVLKQRVLTRDNRLKRGWTGEERYWSAARVRALHERTWDGWPPFRMLLLLKSAAGVLSAK